ncbi:hypothetical protein DCCM_3693 [Desulfocucumis palustris]|uniref:Uncharacterized protein n=1 Tax=Desulfocucumis palustris TaxID=1898651 RepID=A0A2L2XEY0_9FIRM|nr:hypothetical protein DCCM_3693 [Desulfocucumis palustris]
MYNKYTGYEKPAVITVYIQRRQTLNLYPKLRVCIFLTVTYWHLFLL